MYSPKITYSVTVNAANETVFLKQTVVRPQADMKRASGSQESPSSGSGPHTKKAKASQACASCRKAKTRCELLDDPRSGTLRCHRCRVIGTECSFETADIIHFIPKEKSVIETHTHSQTIVVAPLSFADLDEVTSESQNEASTGRRLQPEDLVPSPGVPWGFVDRQDWTASPMLAIQEVACFPQPIDPGNTDKRVGELLSNILTATEIASCLDMWAIWSSLYCAFYL